MISATAVIYPGLQPYLTVYEAMQHFTQTRTFENDELWLLEHEPVFTQGYAGRPEHLLQSTTIPVIQSDRGGQITYHGPGQLIIYVLIELKRAQLNIHQLVRALEQSVINYLSHLNIVSHRRAGAPGVYVQNAKICSIGLRVKKNCTYHGLALNINMDLTPFSYINPCGIAQLQVTQLYDLGIKIPIAQVRQELLYHLQEQLKYTTIHFKAPNS